MSDSARALVRVALVLDDSLERGAVPIGELPILWVRFFGSVRESAAEIRKREAALFGRAASPEVHWFEAVDKPVVEELSAVVDLIALHHSEYVTDGPWDEIVVFGLENPEATMRCLRDELGLAVDVERCTIFNVDPAPSDESS